ncbi:FAD/NAD(P)-binding domain-containing protein [Sphaerosporella brunnea]|uniref:FAD/NAD(P)-binding domain-containing protein n=1 Tax=Sphaerosporella brunnea TaxID=1250544 RepID=A0A5J5EQT5_9PEZI|nr:FAD/NAD(P)-binding domain-containing protein [Sphaerosporella brunnea]
MCRSVGKVSDASCAAIRSIQDSLTSAPHHHSGVSTKCLHFTNHTSSSALPTMPPKRVLIVGAGAAGMSCAHLLSQHPEKFHVTLIESTSYCGGQAFSVPISESLHGASWLNQGVQGGSPVFRHTLHLMSALGFPASPVKLQVSFGKNESFWSNAVPATSLLSRHQSEIRRFSWVVKVVPWLFTLIPVAALLRSFGFSTEFVQLLILPSIALFLGTGNATPQVPGVIMALLFTSKTVGMWAPVDSQRLVATEPDMVVFPELSAFYHRWEEKLRRQGVEIRLSTMLSSVDERSSKGVKVTLSGPHGETMEERYDEMVLCVLADTAKRVLGSSATWLERRVLGATKWSDDVTVTHYDREYMDSFYTLAAASTESPAKEFNPMYFVRPAPEDPSKIELSFDCSNYQAQFRNISPDKTHVYQSIFLNEARDSELWTKGKIDREKVIREKWWHQLCHAWTHYVFVVPWLWLVNWRARRTLFAGSWTLVNCHEVAVISGMAAAFRLGADYPQEMRDDRVGWNAFWGYCLLVHGMWVKGGPWLRKGK